MKKRHSSKQNFDFNIKTQNRFDILPIERCERKNFHQNNPRNIKRSTMQQSTQNEIPKIHSKNLYIHQSQSNQKPFYNKNFAWRSENDRNATYSNKFKNQNAGNHYSLALQLRKWNEQQQQQKQIYYKPLKKWNYEKFNRRKNDDASNKFNQQCNINQFNAVRAIVGIITQWIRNGCPEKYQKSSMNRKILAEKMRVFI